MISLLSRIYYINLDTDVSRRKLTEDSLKNCGVPYTRHPGVLLKDSNELYDKYLSSGVLLKHTKNNAGNIGGNLAHISLIDKISRKKDNSYYLILEDDEIILEDSIENTVRCVESVHNNFGEFDVLNMNVLRAEGDLFDESLDILKTKSATLPRCTIAYKCPNIWTSAYVVSTEGCKKILDEFKKRAKYLKHVFNLKAFDVPFAYVCIESKKIDYFVVGERDKYFVHDERESSRQLINKRG